MSLIEARNVDFAYNGNRVLKDLSFVVEPGELFCLLGPNGCGKTTLLDCIMGHLKPGSGEVFLNGSNIDRNRPGQIARQIAYVPQTHDKTFPYSVMDMVMMGRSPYLGMFDRPGHEDRMVVEEAMETVGIAHLRKRAYTQLSGGEVQMVMVARALAQKTAVIVMDEPTAHLDFKHELVIMEKIVELMREQALTVIMATHFPNHCFYFENRGINIRVAMMNNQTLIALGSPGEILTEANLRELYDVNTRVLSFPVDAYQEMKQIIAVSTIEPIDDHNGGRGF